MRGMFEDSKAFNQSLIGWTNMSGVRDLRNMFRNSESFNNNISNWDVSDVIDMHSMFILPRHSTKKSQTGIWKMSFICMICSVAPNPSIKASLLGSLQARICQACLLMRQHLKGEVSRWDVHQVRDFEGMFQDATSFNGDIRHWDVSSGADFSLMFQGAASFSQSLCWEIHSRATVGSMFDGTNGADNACSPSQPPPDYVAPQKCHLQVHQFLMFQYSCPH